MKFNVVLECLCVCCACANDSEFTCVSTVSGMKCINFWSLNFSNRYRRCREMKTSEVSVWSSWFVLICTNFYCEIRCQTHTTPIETHGDGVCERRGWWPHLHSHTHKRNIIRMAMPNDTNTWIWNMKTKISFFCCWLDAWIVGAQTMATSEPNMKRRTITTQISVNIFRTYKYNSHQLKINNNYENFNITLFCVRPTRELFVVAVDLLAVVQRWIAIFFVQSQWHFFPPTSADDPN